MNTTEKRARIDWALLFFIIPIGIILIIFVGQLAIRIVPFWSVNADMKSNLEPDPNSPRPFALLQPLMPQLLTPMAWAENYLTPGVDISFPAFVTFEPTASPSSTSVTPTATSPTPTETPSPTATATTPAPTQSTPPATKPSGNLCEDPTASNYGDKLPCTYPPPPPTTCQDTTASNYGGSLPCTYPPPPPTTCLDAAASNFGQPLPCKYPVVSTPPVGVSQVSVPSELEVGTGPNNTSTTSDSNIGSIADGNYIVISLGVRVESTPDNNYDLVFYEFNNGGTVYMDWIIVGLSMSSTGSSYYEVFNWGNGSPDLNSNLGDVTTTTGTENGDQAIALTEYYDSDGAGSAPQTGVLIDVDTATSNPPPGLYTYVVVISPGGVGGGAQVDAIQTVEVPTPTP